MRREVVGSSPTGPSKNKEKKMERLYIVTRRDLPKGVQLAQTGHAVSAFAVAHPELHARWHKEGNNLICLAAKDEAELKAQLELGAAATAHFHEPDLGNQLTAIALTGEVRRRLSSFPKALNEPPPDDGKCRSCH